MKIKTKVRGGRPISGCGGGGGGGRDCA